EALDVVPETDARGAVPARIEHLESLGYETLAHLRLEGDEHARLVARLVGMPAPVPGQRGGLVVDPAQGRPFDRACRLLPYGPRPGPPCAHIRNVKTSVCTAARRRPGNGPHAAARRPPPRPAHRSRSLRQSDGREEMPALSRRAG